MMRKDMSQTTTSLYQCQNCKRFKNWGKYACKKCSLFYSSEYQSNTLSYKQVQKKKRKSNPAELVKLYDWLRENVFSKGYVNPSNLILFSYKRNGSRGAWCNKTQKEIRMSRLRTSKRMFDKEKDIIYDKELDNEELKTQKRNQYKLMLHEMLHLRMPHHRKSFIEKEKELLKIFEMKSEGLF